MKATWSWHFNTATADLSGTIEGVDLRDAVSRILTQDTGDGRLFGEVHAVPVDVLMQAPGNASRTLTIAQDGFTLDVEAVPDMYVAKEDGMVVLRQSRFRDQLSAGKEHPHDVCAVARDVAEMHSMVDKHWPDADYSAVS
jgi:hypothetical protein